MFKKLTTTTLLMILLTSLAACGGKSTKKKVDSLGAEDSKSQNTNNDKENEDLRDTTFLDKEIEGITSRMKDAQLFEIAREGIGRHQIIYFPAKQDSRTPADHDERWYFRNPTIGHFTDDKAKSNNVAFRIYPKAGQSSATTFEFELSPVVEANNNEFTQLKLELDDNDQPANVIIKCGNLNETYEARPFASNIGIAYYPLNQDDESYDHFQSPCAIYSQEQLEKGLILTADDEDKIELEDDDNNTDQVQNEEDEDCLDEETEELAPCEEKEIKTTCDESRFMRYHVKVICHHSLRSSECSQVITQVGIVNQGTTEIGCQNTCKENTCSSTNVVDTEIGTASDRMAQAGELSDLELLPYCTSKNQRTYMRKSEKVQEVEEEISALVDYCALRPELGKHCEATKMHDLHKKIDRKKKDQAKIIASCIKRRDKDAARGDYSQPEMNTCGFITRGTLTNHRNNLNAYKAELSHQQATCKSDGKCNNKKEEKLTSKISHRMHKIEQLEKKCNVK